MLINNIIDIALERNRKVFMNDILKQYGYADGYYSRKCSSCNCEFTGDKRAWNCKNCAMKQRNIIDISKNKPHKSSMVICLKCFKRWIAVREESTRLVDLECPCCGKIESVIETGEIIDE